MQVHGSGALDIMGRVCLWPMVFMSVLEIGTMLCTNLFSPQSYFGFLYCCGKYHKQKERVEERLHLSHGYLLHSIPEGRQDANSSEIRGRKH